MSNQQRNAVEVTNLSKSFKLPNEQHNGIKQLLLNLSRRKKGYELQKVLKDISFEIKEGEFFGIVGRNGSGKSTLLKLLADIYAPNAGSIRINGSLTPFIELGVGFNPELTGRENVYMNGALLGFDHSQVDGMYDEIVEFAELKQFMDQKLKNYSSGMQVRLAFSIAIRAKSDILLLDEVLAVGDAVFQKKCYDYFKQLKKEKRTVILVSHDTGVLQEYCTNGILLENGRIVESGSIKQVLNKYQASLNKSESNKQTENGGTGRWGSGQVVVDSIRVGQGDQTKKHLFADDTVIPLSVTFVAKENAEKPVYGVTITDGTGATYFQSNTLWCHVPVNDHLADEKIILDLNIPNAFNAGTYFISPAVSDSNGVSVYDWRENMASFEVTKQQKSHGYINVSHKLTIRHD